MRKALAPCVGIDRVLMGGDYAAAIMDPLDFLERAKLSDEEKGKIAGANAETLLVMG